MRTRERFQLVTVLADVIALLIAGAVASQRVFDTWRPWDATQVATQNPRPMLFLLVIGVAVGSWISLRTISPYVKRPVYGRTVMTLAIAAATIAIGTFVLRTYFSRTFVLLTLALWFVLSLLHRAWQRRRPWIERMVVITDEKELADDLAEGPHAEVVEVLAPRGAPPEKRLPRDVSLVVDLRAVLSDGMAQFVSSSTLAGLEVRPFGQVYEQHAERVPLLHVNEGWEISVPLGRRQAYAPFKRVIEVTATVITAPIWLMLMAFTAIAIRIDSPGPALFKQKRLGLDDQPFTIYKFRTMVVDADKDGPQFTTPGDPRITRLGRFLRSTRLDEVPQLINVLRGDVALVGPRAEQVAFAEQFQQVIPFYRYRHLVRPGITGWAQVNSGYADSLDDTIEKLTYDLYYVRHMSLWLDASVLARSVLTVISGKGAQ
jgi:exopolysaccharide biosynthesis polyprenyl glycosylphosphotransferase